MFTITFNSKTSAYACNEQEGNYLFISYQESYINDLLKHRGYVYTNDIYELFGVEWNPEWENLVYTDKNKPIKFKIREKLEDGFVIDID